MREQPTAAPTPGSHTGTRQRSLASRLNFPSYVLDHAHAFRTTYTVMHTHTRSEPRARLCTRITLYTHHGRRDRALVRVKLSTSVELHSRARACIQSTRIGILQYACRGKSQIYMRVSACRCIVRTNGRIQRHESPKPGIELSRCREQRPDPSTCEPQPMHPNPDARTLD